MLYRYKLYVAITSILHIQMCTCMKVETCLKRYYVHEYNTSLGSRLHIKVIRTVYTHDLSMASGRISQGVVDLIGYHLIRQHTYPSIQSLYTDLCSPDR